MPNKAYQKMFTDFPSHLLKSDQPFTKPDESHPKCDTLNCDSVAEYLDPMDNTLCTDCVERDIQETDGR